MDAERLRITNLAIKGFKTFKSLERFELRNLNVLIGANGAGKSNLITFFRFLYQAVRDAADFNVYIQKEGGPDAFLHRGAKHTETIEFTCGAPGDWFHPGEGWVTFNTSGQAIVGVSRRVIGPPPTTPPPRVELILPRYQQYHLSDVTQTAAIKRVHPRNDNLKLKPDAGNLAPFLAMLSEQHPPEYQSILQTIRQIAPFFGDFVFRDDRHIQLEWTEKSDPDTPRWADLLSDGTLRFIALATILLQPDKYLPQLVIIDEPELGLHPYALLLLAELVQQAAERTQVIIATHSTALINACDPGDIVIVDRVGDESTLKRLDLQDLQTWLSEYTVGDLWQKNVLGGTP